MYISPIGGCIGLQSWCMTGCITAHHWIFIHGTIKSPSTTALWDEESNKSLQQCCTVIGNKILLLLIHQFTSPVTLTSFSPKVIQALMVWITLQEIICLHIIDILINIEKFLDSAVMMMPSDISSSTSSYPSCSVSHVKFDNPCIYFADYRTISYHNHKINN